jgi:surfeit locus 1 family protein
MNYVNKKGVTGALLLTLSGVAILCLLGTWQIKRLTWKEDIISTLETEYAKDPAQNLYSFTDLQQDDAVRYGSIEGVFDYKKEILVGPKTYEGDIGFHILTPLDMGQGQHILVNRGWIGEDRTDEIMNPQGRVLVIGLIRAPDWNAFTPDNSPENNVWTKLDINQIARAKNIETIAPLIMYAESASEPFGRVVMTEQRWLPRNKHKQYAIFWFSMAFILLVIFGLFVRQQKKTS